MNLITAAILGLVQGLAEFLPISSSGHLNLFQALFDVKIEHQLLFNILLHAGTLVAVLIYFWKDWWAMLRHPIRNKTLLLLFVASLPALAAKVILGDQLNYFETHNALLGVCFLFTGLLLTLTQLLSRHAQKLQQQGKEIGVAQAICMGCLQTVGMLPGISRSGSTIFGGVAVGVSREKAARFSFMMSAPAIVAGMLSEGYHVWKGGGLGEANMLAIGVGMTVAAISGYFAIRFMMRLISKASLHWFALYTILLGILVIILQATGFLVDVPTTQSISSASQILIRFIC